MENTSASQVSSSNVKTAQTLLTMVYSAVPIIAGLDKFSNILVDWSIYLNPIWNTWWVAMPGYAAHQIVGVIEIAAGVLVFVNARLGGYLVAAWLTLVAVALISTGKFYDIAVRDLVMATGALALALLSKNN